MRHQFQTLILCGTIVVASLYSKAQAPALSWQLVKDKDGIKVYTASAASSSLKYIKVEAILDGTVAKFSTVFRDVPKQTKWVYKTKRAYIIHANGADDLLYYNETALPWPMSNRDVAIHMQIKEDVQQHQLIVTSVGVPTAIPETGNVVRVPHFQGNWTVQDAGPNKIHVRYFLDIDPGGAIPAWIINLFITKGPYETFIGLANQLKS
jgi:hypothetical protein